MSKLKYLKPKVLIPDKCDALQKLLGPNVLQESTEAGQCHLKVKFLSRNYDIASRNYGFAIS